VRGLLQDSSSFGPGGGVSRGGCFSLAFACNSSQRRQLLVSSSSGAQRQWVSDSGALVLTAGLLPAGPACLHTCAQVPATRGCRVPVTSWRGRRRCSRTRTSSSAHCRSRAGWTGAQQCILRSFQQHTGRPWLPPAASACCLQASSCAAAGSCMHVVLSLIKPKQLQLYCQSRRCVV
jgi:hypothetical protein